MTRRRRRHGVVSFELSPYGVSNTMDGYREFKFVVLKSINSRSEE